MATNYPPGVDNSHPHFHEGGGEVECPECGARIPAEAGDCNVCGYGVDEDAVRDQQEAAAEPPEWA
jgi:predicted amidophosphoribosyltransferase